MKKEKEIILSSVNLSHSAPTRQGKSSDHQNAVPAKQNPVNVQKSLEKAEISVTLTLKVLSSQHGMACVFTCA